MIPGTIETASSPAKPWNAAERWPGMIWRSLENREHLVQLDVPSGKIVLAKRSRGELIDDPDCDDIKIALESGVFRRFEVTRDGAPLRYTWMLMCFQTPEAVEEALRAEMQALTEQELKLMLVGLTFRTVALQDSADRAARRAGQPRRLD